jgi:hypothetical protein
MTATAYREKCREISRARRMGEDREGNSFNVPFLNGDVPSSLFMWVDGFENVCHVEPRGVSAPRVPDAVMIQLRDWLNETYPKGSQSLLP